MTKHLTERDLKDGEELMQILENLGEEDRKQVIIYASALKDRQMIESNKKAGQEVGKMMKYKRIKKMEKEKKTSVIFKTDKEARKSWEDFSYS